MSSFRRELSLLLPLVLIACDSHRTNPNGPSTPTPPSATYTITGHVTETPPTQTIAVSHATVSVIAADGTRLPGITASTDDTGAFTLANLPAGRQTLVAEAAGYDASRLDLTIAGPLDGVQVRMDPQGEQTQDISAPCGKPPQAITFPVHRAGPVVVQGTATGFGLNTDYIIVRLSLDGQSHIADSFNALLFPGFFLSLNANVPGAGIYQASILLDTCFPVELRVTAPK